VVTVAAGIEAMIEGTSVERTVVVMTVQVEVDVVRGGHAERAAALRFRWRPWEGTAAANEASETTARIACDFMLDVCA
jgi:hypothetical protein